MTLDKVKKLLAEQLNIDAEKITESSKVIDDLGADSLDLVDLVMTIEEEFDVEISDDQVDVIKTVGDIVKYIEENAH